MLDYIREGRFGPSACISNGAKSFWLKSDRILADPKNVVLISALQSSSSKDVSLSHDVAPL
jgi:hypothetical protein